MAKRDSFLLRIDPTILQGIRQWSEDEMRSMNGQIEYLLRQSLRSAGRLPKQIKPPPPDSNTPSSHGSSAAPPPQPPQTEPPGAPARDTPPPASD